MRLKEVDPIAGGIAFDANIDGEKIPNIQKKRSLNLFVERLTEINQVLLKRKAKRS